MKNFYQLLAGGLLATILSAVPLSSVAQNSREGYIAAFTPEELNILKREYSIDHPGEWVNPHNIWGYKNVRKRGGEGRNRWLLIELTADDFGNQYLLNTRTLKYRENTLNRSDGRIVAELVTQVFYNNPKAHNGVAVRHVLMDVACSGHAVRGLAIWPPHPMAYVGIGILGYVDYDSNGNIVGRKQMPQASRRVPQSRLEAYNTWEVCKIADRLPDDLELLQRGLDRKTVHEPSLYD